MQLFGLPLQDAGQDQPAARGHVPGTAAAPAASAAWPGCWPAPDRRCLVRHRAGRAFRATWLSRALSMVAFTAAGSMSTASVAAAPCITAADGQDAGAAAVVERARSFGTAPACVASQRRHMRVVGWVPVPKASPGSSRMTRRAAGGTSCQLGTTQNSGVISTGANWRLRDAAPSPARASRPATAGAGPGSSRAPAAPQRRLRPGPRSRTAPARSNGPSPRPAVACRVRRTRRVRHRCRRRRLRPTPTRHRVRRSAHRTPAPPGLAARAGSVHTWRGARFRPIAVVRMRAFGSQPYPRDQAAGVCCIPPSHATVPAGCGSWVAPGAK